LLWKTYKDIFLLTTNKASKMTNICKIFLIFSLSFSLKVFSVPLDPNSAPPDRLGSTNLDVINTSTLPPASSTDWKIRPKCLFVKSGYFDPIVFPGIPAPSSHHHTFVGNDSINPNSTSESLRTSGGSTCMGGIANRSSYWWPTLYDTSTGQVKTPKQTLLYYNTRVVSEVADTLVVVPQGLKMIAGDSSNTSVETASNYHFSCGSVTANGGKTIPPNCSATQDLRFTLSFPMCWDGVNLDSPDHKSHMSYEVGTTGNRCPATHPERIPNITFIVDFNLDVNNETTNWRLSSDTYDSSLPPGLSMHGDVMSAWDDVWLQQIVDNCLKGHKDCGSALLGKNASGQAKKFNNIQLP